MRRHVIWAHPERNGDGYTPEDVLRMAQAEARALRRIFPDVTIEVRVAASQADVVHQDEDQDLAEHADRLWVRLTADEGWLTEVEDIVAWFDKVGTTQWTQEG